MKRMRSLSLDTNPPSKKRKIDTNQQKQTNDKVTHAKAQNIFTHPNDFQKYETIYQTLSLCNIPQLQSTDIRQQIAIFATGEIHTCNLCDMEILELQSNPFQSTYIRNKGKDGSNTWISKHIYCINCANNKAADGKKHFNWDYGDDNMFFHCESTYCKPGYYPRTEMHGMDDLSICKECIENIPLTECNNGCPLYIYQGQETQYDHTFMPYQTCEDCNQKICPVCSRFAIHPDAEPDDFINDTRCDQCDEFIYCYVCARRNRCFYCDYWLCIGCCGEHECEIL